MPNLAHWLMHHQLNDKSIPNTQFEIDDLHSSSLKWTIKCKAPENICYGSSRESGSVCIKRNSYSYECDPSSSYIYYKPLCAKQICEILCEPNNSCKVQIKSIIFWKGKQIAHVVDIELIASFSELYSLWCTKNSVMEW